jgi:hypothetical protein
MGKESIPSGVQEKFEVEETHHASAILQADFPAEWGDLLSMLAWFTVGRSDIREKGGRKSAVAKKIDKFFYAREWKERKFKIEVKADDAITLAPTHQVDYYRNEVAIETEWNNKDPFFGRDLTSFRLLFDLNVVSVGIIITRSIALEKIIKELGRAKSFGASTTHMGKLRPKLCNRASGGCPVLAFGIKPAAYDPDS